MPRAPLHLADAVPTSRPHVHSKLVRMTSSRTATSFAIPSVAILVSLLVLVIGPGRAQTPAKDTPAKDAPATYTVISPIFSQLVKFAMPATFVTSFEDTKPTNYIREAVPKGETVNKWTQMITVTGAKGLAASNPQLTPGTVAGSIAGGFKKACPDTYTATALGETRYGDHDAFVAVAGCGRIDTSADKHGETALIIAVKGSADYYTVQWAERMPTSNAKPAIDNATWTARLKQLSPIRVCPIVAGETAPYPSCVNKTAN